MPRNQKHEPINTDLNFHRWNLWSLIFFLITAIIARGRINDSNIRILFSLGLVIASAVGRYGSIMASKLHPLWKHPVYESYRNTVYTVMFLVGVFGLIFG